MTTKISLHTILIDLMLCEPVIASTITYTNAQVDGKSQGMTDSIAAYAISVFADVLNGKPPFGTA